MPPNNKPFPVVPFLTIFYVTLPVTRVLCSYIYTLICIQMGKNNILPDGIILDLYRQRFSAPVSPNPILL